MVIKLHCLTALELNASKKKTKKFKQNRYIITNIHRIQAQDLIICGKFCFGLIDFKLKGKNLLDYTNFFSLDDYEKNDTIIEKNFQ